MIPKAHIRRLNGPNSSDSLLQKFGKEGAKRGRPVSFLAHEVNNDLSSPKDIDVKGPPRKELRRMLSSSAEEEVHVLPSIMWDFEEVIFCLFFGRIVF